MKLALSFLTLIGSMTLFSQNANAYLTNNVALASRGAIAFDNGHFDDYGIVQDGWKAIDGDASGYSYWAGRWYIHPQSMWVIFDKPYMLYEVQVLERADAYMRTGEIELLSGLTWSYLTGINKASSDFRLAFSPVRAEGIRLTVYSVTAPPTWYNKVACVYELEAAGVDVPVIPVPPSIALAVLGIFPLFHWKRKQSKSPRTR